MAFQLSPGVNVTEKDITLVVPAVATTPGGFIAPFQWGPAEIATTIGTEKDLASVFGTPKDSGYYSKFWFCASNFLAYGNNLKVVRLLDTTDKNAVSTGSAIAVKNLDDYNSKSSATLSAVGPWIAKYPGALGNSLKVVVLDAASSDDYGMSSGEDFSDYMAEFDNVPGTSDFAAELGVSYDEIHVLIIDEDGLFSGTPGTILEKFPALSKGKNALNADGTTNYYKNVLNANSQYIWWASHPSGGTNWGDDIVSGKVFGILSNSFHAKSLVSGVTHADDAISDTAYGTAYTTYFGDADSIDVSLLIAGPLSASAANLVVQVAESRKDCIAFVSPNVSASSTSTTNLSTALTYRTGLTASSYGVMDSGYKLQYDRYNDQYRYIPLCADVAGCCVRTDENRDPWYSPAGFDRGRILNNLKLAYNPNKTHRDELYKKGINPIVSFDGSGAVLFGDKTLLQKPSAFDRINVRRLFIVLEKAIATASRFILFEFNDEFTRSQFRLLTEPFLRDVQSRRGIQDFRVVCDTTNNTAQVIDTNRFVADIYIKPNRSINFIQLNFIATPTGLTFEEVLGA